MNMSYIVYIMGSIQKNQLRNNVTWKFSGMKIIELPRKNATCEEGSNTEQDVSTKDLFFIPM